MDTLTFYHQVRQDHGRRTGIEFAGRELLQAFEAGEDRDPALLWYVDIDCVGKNLPDNPDDARNWFLANRKFFVDQLLRVAEDQLDAGFDVELRPFRVKVPGPGGITVRIGISAVRRLVAREMAKNVRSLARNWPSLLKQLAPLSVV